MDGFPERRVIKGFVWGSYICRPTTTKNAFRKKSAAGTSLNRVAWGKSGEKDSRISII